MTIELLLACIIFMRCSILDNNPPALFSPCHTVSFSQQLSQRTQVSHVSHESRVTRVTCHTCHKSHVSQESHVSHVSQESHVLQESHVSQELHVSQFSRKMLVDKKQENDTLCMHECAGKVVCHAQIIDDVHHQDISIISFLGLRSHCHTTAYHFPFRT
jgi:hypothetical protein